MPRLFLCSGPGDDWKSSRLGERGSLYPCYTLTTTVVLCQAVQHRKTLCWVIDFWGAIYLSSVFTTTFEGEGKRIQTWLTMVCTLPLRQTCFVFSVPLATLRCDILFPVYVCPCDDFWGDFANGCHFPLQMWFYIQLVSVCFFCTGVCNGNIFTHTCLKYLWRSEKCDIYLYTHCLFSCYVYHFVILSVAGSIICVHEPFLGFVEIIVVTVVVCLPIHSIWYVSACVWFSLTFKSYLVCQDGSPQ